MRMPRVVRADLGHVYDVLESVSHSTSRSSTNRCDAEGRNQRFSAGHQDKHGLGCPRTLMLIKVEGLGSS